MEFIEEDMGQVIRARHILTFFIQGLGCFWLLSISPPLAAGQAQSPAITGIEKALQSGHYAQALNLSDIALKNTPDSYKLWTLKGLVLDRSGRPAQAGAAYGQALKLAPYYLPALEGAAELRYQQGDPGAIPLLRKILTVGGDNTTTHGMLAVLEYKQKDCVSAAKDFKVGLPAAAKDSAMLNEYGFCLAELKQYSDAVPVLQQALDLQPESSADRFNVALVQWMARDTEAALQTIRPLLASPTATNEVLNLGADISQSLDDTPLAVTLLRRAIVQQPKTIANYLKFALLSNKYGSYDAGIKILNIGIVNVPSSAPLYVARGILYSQLYIYDKAMADFEQANKLDPKLAVATSAEGLMQSQQHNVDAAIETFRQNAKKRPDDAFTQYLLAEALSEKSYAPQSSGWVAEIAAASRALSLDPKLVVADDLLASLYLQSGQFDLAIRHSEEALHEDPKDQQALYHLVLGLRRTNRKGEVPGLIQRLAQLRREAKMQAQHQTRYQISVER